MNVTSRGCVIRPSIFQSFNTKSLTEYFSASLRSQSSHTLLLRNLVVPLKVDIGSYRRSKSRRYKYGCVVQANQETPPPENVDEDVSEESSKSDSSGTSAETDVKSPSPRLLPSDKEPPKKQTSSYPFSWNSVVKSLSWTIPSFLLFAGLFVALSFLPPIRSPLRSKFTSAESQKSFKKLRCVYMGKVPFSYFLKEVEQDNVSSVSIDGHKLSFVLKKADVVLTRGSDTVDEVEDLRLHTLKPADMPTPYKLFIDKGIEFSAPDRGLLGLINVLSVGLLYAGLIVVLVGRIPARFLQNSTGVIRGGKGSTTGKGAGSTITFADVAGVDEAKEELEEIVEYLKDPQRFILVGARPPRGVLLVGPPGTGKTLLAKAVAGEANVPFISCAASEFIELYVGMGAFRVRELFAKARLDSPSILFIDEIDAVAKARDGRMRSNGNDERDQTLNQLLTELDGFDSSPAVIVLAATNRADVLDPALRRPGRFDRVVSVESPDKQGREEILRVHLQKSRVPLTNDIDISAIATATAGFTGADLANLVNEAALLTARSRRTQVGQIDFEHAVERSRGGIEKRRSSLGSQEKGVVARHEVGHAILGTAVARILTGFPRVEKLSIVPRTGGALGFTYMPPSGEERMLIFADEVKGHLVTLLGGRAAEEVAFAGRVSTGAMDDIRRATDMAYKAVAEYGLSSRVGPLSLATLSGGGMDDSGGGVMSPWGKDQGHVTELVQSEVKELLQEALQTARQIVQENMAVLEGLGSALEVEEKVQGAVLDSWLVQVQLSPSLASFLKPDQLKAMDMSAAVLPPSQMDFLGDLLVEEP